MTHKDVESGELQKYIIGNISKKTQNISYNIKDNLVKMWTELNKNIYGLLNAKEKIMEIMCSKLINGNNNGKILTLCGTYGVGKTSFAKCIASALEMPFDIISFNSSLVLSSRLSFISIEPTSLTIFFDGLFLKVAKINSIAFFHAWAFWLSEKGYISGLPDLMCQ